MTTTAPAIRPDEVRSENAQEPEQPANNFGIEFEVLRNESALRANKHAWDALVDRCPATVFQSFEWLSLWWRHFGASQDRSLHVLFGRKGRELVAIIPLFIEVDTFFGFRVNKRMSFLGCGVKSHGLRGLFDRYSPSDILDAIIDPAYVEQSAFAFWNYLSSNRSLWDELELPNVPADSEFLNHVVQLLREKNIPLSLKLTDRCPRLKHPIAAKEYLRTLKSSVRRRMAQSMGALTEDKNVVVESVASYNEVESSLGDLIYLHQTRWNRLGYAGVFSDGRFSRFQNDVAHQFYLRGWLWLKSVRVNGTRVAARLGFTFKNRVYDYLSGMNELGLPARQRPGMSLLLMMIDDAAKDGIEHVEFLRGTEQYKLELTDDVVEIRTLRVKNPSSRVVWRSQLSNLRRLLEAALYRLYIETASLRAHVRNNPTPIGVASYAAFRYRCLRDLLRKRSGNLSSSIA